MMAGHPQLKRRQRRPRWAALLLLILLLPACLRDNDTDPTAAVSAPTAPAVTTRRAIPSVPVANLTPTATVTAPPTQTPTTAASRATPSLETVPDDQVVDLPDVTLAYTIDASLRDVDSGIVDALSSVTITNREDAPLEQLFFRVAPAEFNAFRLNSLTHDGTAVDPVGSDNGTTLDVALTPPLTPGGTTVLAFDFTLVLPEAEGSASIGRDGDVLRLGYWYPMLSNDGGYPPLLDPPYTLAADYSVSFTAPSEVVVAASGELSEPPSEDESTTHYTFSVENGRDFALMLSVAYEVEERTTAAGVVIRQYTLATEYGNSDAERAAIRDQAFAVAAQSLGEFATNIGPYPWPSLSLVEAGPGIGGGIEYTALTIISYDSGGLANLVAHETAHMWFYAILGTRTQADPWIDEGAATFLGNGISSGEYARSSDRGLINYVMPLGASVDDLNIFNDGQWIMAVYTQGGSFFADMYIAMGDDAFWRAMQDIYSENRFAIVTPWELLNTFQHHSPVDLLPVYDRYFAYAWLDDLR